MHLIVIPHAEAQPRATWTGDIDVRPLTERGREQAAAVADGIGPVDAVYSSPSLRCVQTAEPLAARSAVPVVALEALREAAGEARSWDHHFTEAVRLAVHGASIAGRVMTALDRVDGRVAVCSHGDTIPITIGYLAARLGVDIPPLAVRGGWYEVTEGAITAHGTLGD